MAWHAILCGVDGDISSIRRGGWETVRAWPVVSVLKSIVPCEQVNSWSKRMQSMYIITWRRLIVTVGVDAVLLADVDRFVKVRFQSKVLIDITHVSAYRRRASRC